MLKKRIINIRVMFVIFCGLMVGIFFPYFLIRNLVSRWILLIVGILIALMMISLFAYAVFTHNSNLKIKYREKISPLIKCSVIGFIVAFVIGIFLTCQPIISMFSITDFGNSEVTVTGVVSDYVQNNDTHKKFIISECIIDTGINYVSNDYKICVYSPKFLDVNLGDKITFKSTLDKFDFYKSSDFVKLIQNIGYSAYISDNFSIEMGSKDLKDIVKQEASEVLHNNLNEDNADISYAVLFGEKQGLNENISETFSYAGISHILAVSGLHIGVLVAFIYFFLKKLKINKYVRVVILSLILLFYSYLCSFTPSVCRASIMAIIGALCDNFKIENDSLSSLSIAGIIILLFNPFALFLVSFQLSFLCIFSIISIAPSLTRILKKVKLPEFLASGLSVSVATNLAILPVCFNVFTKVSLLGVISNILILPIFSITYVLLFFITIVSSLFSSFGFLLYLPNLFLHLIKTIANGISSLSIGILKVFNISYWALFLLIITALILHFLMIRKFYKGSFIILLTIVIISMFALNSVPHRYLGDNIVFNLKYKSNLCYYIKDNNVTLVGSNIESNLIDSEMKKLKLNKIDTIIAYDIQINELNNLINICKEYNVKNIYIPKAYKYNEISEKFNSVRYFSTNIVVDNMKFTAINYKNQIIGVYLEIEDICNILIPEISPTKAESKYLAENYANVDFIYINSENIKIDLNLLNPKNIITNELSSVDNIELENQENFVINKNTVGEYL